MYKHGQGVEKDYRLPLNGLRKPLNAMTPLPGIPGHYVSLRRRKTCRSPTGSRLYRKVQSSGTRDVSQEIREMKIYCRDKNKGRGISFGPYSFIAVRNQTITAQTGVSGTGQTTFRA